MLSSFSPRKTRLARTSAGWPGANPRDARDEDRGFAGCPSREVAGHGAYAVMLAGEQLQSPRPKQLVVQEEQAPSRRSWSSCLAPGLHVVLPRVSPYLRSQEQLHQSHGHSGRGLDPRPRRSGRELAGPGRPHRHQLGWISGQANELVEGGCWSDGQRRFLLLSRVSPLSDGGALASSRRLAGLIAN